MSVRLDTNGSPLQNHTGYQLVSHGGWADHEGELVFPDSRHDHLVRSLREYHPELKLLFDRGEGLWGIYRLFRQENRVALDWDGSGWSVLSWLRPVWFRALKIAWFTRIPGNKIKMHYRDPGDFVFRYLKSKHREEFDLYLAGQRHMKQMREMALRKERVAREKASAAVGDIVDDAMPCFNRDLVQVNGTRDNEAF